MELKKEIRIAISGKSGCGNTTVSGLLAQKLGIKLINYTFRQLAEENKESDRHDRKRTAGRRNRRVF